MKWLSVDEDGKLLTLEHSHIHWDETKIHHQTEWICGLFLQHAPSSQNSVTSHDLCQPVYGLSHMYAHAADVLHILLNMHTKLWCANWANNVVADDTNPTPISTTNIYYDRQTQQCFSFFFINLLFYKLRNVLILTTCFGHRMTINRSTRAIMYLFLLCNGISLWNVMGSHYVFTLCVSGYCIL